jgi:hypothetical protein
MNNLMSRNSPGNKIFITAGDHDLTENIIHPVLALHPGKTAMSPDFMVAFAFAKPFLDATGDICMAWMHLWRAAVAAPMLEKLAGSMEPAARMAKAAKNKEAAFYEGVLQPARYFINTILPVTMGKMKAIKACDAATIEIPEAAFGG